MLAILDVKMFSIVEGGCYLPVSYTHLDVYKRQVQPIGNHLPLHINMQTMYDVDLGVSFGFV